MKKRVDAILMATITDCFERGLLLRGAIPPYVIEIPNNPDHGHFATNVSMVLASTQRRRPADIARTIVDNLRDEEHLLECAEIAGPGFINFKIRGEEWCKLLTEIVSLKDGYGRISSASKMATVEMRPERGRRSWSSLSAPTQLVPFISVMAGGLPWATPSAGYLPSAAMTWCGNSTSTMPAPRSGFWANRSTAALNR